VEALAPIIGVTMVAYIALMLGIGALASKRIDGAEDFVVAGRRLTWPLATATLLATWFGAGTLMAAADEVRAIGLQGAALDPLGAGLCLLLFGIFFARPLWEAKLLTLPELFGRRFGDGARRVAAALMVPPYLGWVAAQFMALAGIVTLFFDVPLPVVLCGIAVVSVVYTALGGMWAVTLTDAVQLVIVVAGLAVLFVDVLGQVGGFGTLWDTLPTGHQVAIPVSELPELVGWIGVVAAGALGNIPSQDVSQRVFSAKSATVARAACFTAGGAYLVLGLVPVVLGLAGHVLLGEGEGATVPELAALHLHPAVAVLFVVTLMSVILSTIDGALLAPATVLVHDLAPARFAEPARALVAYRVGIALVGTVSLALALAGESAYALLESSYELGMVSLMAPLTYAVYARTASAPAALATMGVGTALWAGHYVAGVEDFFGVAGVPLGLTAMALSYLAWPVVVRLTANPGPAS